MSGETIKRQAEIDALINETAKDARTPLRMRLFGIAKIGAESPEDLSDLEIREICYALVAHYQKLGIV